MTVTVRELRVSGWAVELFQLASDPTEAPSRRAAAVQVRLEEILRVERAHVEADFRDALDGLRQELARSMGRP